MKPSLISSSLTTLALAGVLYGCGSDSHPPKAPPVQPAQSGAQASSYTPPRADTMQPLTMGQFRGDLVQAQKDIDGTLASLNDLTNPSQQNLRTAYDTYCDRLARMQQHAETMKREADTMRMSRDTYFGNWEQKVSEIDNPTIRASAEARRKRLRDAHEQIVTTSGEAKDAYQPFMKDLQDIKKYLATDLSKSSVADLGDAARKVQTDGATVKSKIGQIISVLDQVEGSGAGSGSGAGASGS